VTSTEKQPWPSDAVIIVAADRGQEIRPQMSSVVYRQCRLCGQALAVDPQTIVEAIKNPLRGDRPVDFLCIRCCTQHDASSIDELHDLRRAN
jgi:hypothetical protein